MNIHYVNFLNQLNNNINKHNEVFYVRENKFVKKVINLFIKYNVIRFIFKKDNYYAIFINCNKKLLFKNFYRKSHLFSLKLKHLNDLNKQQTNYILLNDIGLHNIKYNLRHKKGGIIFLIIYG